MKKYLLALMLMCTMPGMTTAQQNSNGADTAVLTADSTATDEVEAFSDTTQTDTGGVVAVSPVGNNFPFDDEEDYVSVNSILDGLDMGEMAHMGFVLLVLLILFVLAPVFILGLILYFIYKNRKQRMRLAEMAIKNGQPIPQEIVDKPATGADSDLRAKGIRQVFLGIGLTCFLGWMIGDVGAGIGILVLCIGLGNLVIARNAQKQRDELNASDFESDARNA